MCPRPIFPSSATIFNHCSSPQGTNIFKEFCWKGQYWLWHSRWLPGKQLLFFLSRKKVKGLSVIVPTQRFSSHYRYVKFWASKCFFFFTSCHFLISLLCVRQKSVLLNINFYLLPYTWSKQFNIDDLHIIFIWYCKLLLSCSVVKVMMIRVWAARTPCPETSISLILINMSKITYFTATWISKNA